MKPGIVTAVELAAYLKVDPRTINKLALSGIVVRPNSGRGYKLLESVQGYCVHAREAAAGRDSSDETKAAKVMSLLAGASLKEVQKVLAAERLKRESGGWVLESHVVAQWKRNANEFRSWALSLPPKIRAELDLTVAQLAALEKIIDDGLSLTESKSRGPPLLRINYAVRFSHQQGALG